MSLSLVYISTKVIENGLHKSSDTISLVRRYSKLALATSN